MASTQYLLLIVLLQLSSGQASGGKMDGSDLEALLEIRNSLTDVNTNGQDEFFSTWNLSSANPCSSFSGVTCSPLGHVTSLSLGSGPLGGSLSPWPSLSKLTQLAQLILSPGIVTGPIPPQLGLLPSLQVISLPGNRLTGPIPTTLSLLRNLHTLDLSRNRLSGPVPAALLSGLKVLVLAHNDLSGRFPAPGQGSSSLLHLDLSSNRLTGGLPNTIPVTLKYMSASNNRMWGPLNGLDKITDQLEYLDLSMNQFSGPIPSALFRPSLSTLLLQRNNLSGTVPRASSSSSSSYGSGSMVDLSHNGLTGEISPALADVDTLFLNNNRLMGRVPREYGESVSRGTTTTLYLQHNYITGLDWERGVEVPDTASLCLSYNCMDPVLGRCPASAGDRVSRPPSQCTAFKNGLIRGNV